MFATFAYQSVTNSHPFPENNRLEVLRADANASGTYRCEAANQYASHWSEVAITVTGEIAAITPRTRHLTLTS